MRTHSRPIVPRIFFVLWPLAARRTSDCATTASQMRSPRNSRTSGWYAERKAGSSCSVLLPARRSTSRLSRMAGNDVGTFFLSAARTLASGSYLMTLPMLDWRRRNGSAPGRPGAEEDEEWAESRSCVEARREGVV